MFERFTDRARHVVVYAQDEARMLDHNYIGTEHLLLGLLREEEGVAAKALQAMGVSLDTVRQRVEEIIGRGQQPPTGHIPFTPRAKKVLELALREALQLGHNYIGTEHILLGLVREGEGVAVQVLQEKGAHIDRVRQAVIQLLAGYTGGEDPGPVWMGEEQMSEPMSEVAPIRSAVRAEDFPTCPVCLAALGDTIAIASVGAAGGDESTAVRIAYCGRCGTAIGVVP